MKISQLSTLPSFSFQHKLEEPDKEKPKAHVTNELKNKKNEGLLSTTFLNAKQVQTYIEICHHCRCAGKLRKFMELLSKM